MGEADERTYHVARSRITIRFDDITTSRAEVIVSSDDFRLSMGGGVSGAISRAAGQAIESEADKLVPARLGDVLVTSGGSLPARYILHVITIGPGLSDIPSDAIVRQATLKVMDLLPRLGCRSVAFPAIGTGAAHIAPEVAAAQMAETITSVLLDVNEPLYVELYLLDRRGRNIVEPFFRGFEEHLERRLGLETSTAHGDIRLEEPINSSDRSIDDAERERRQQISVMLRHLDARRNAIEASLLSQLTQSGDPPVESLRTTQNELAELQRLRRSYEEELQLVAPSLPERKDSVFLSSTSIDLHPHRKALRELITQLGFTYIGMEDFTPTAQPPTDLIRGKVSEAGIYLGVLGMRYGFIDTASGLSMTELEYRQALASKKEILMFVMDKSAPITVEMVESDPTGYARLLDFRTTVLTSHVCGLFTDVRDIVRRAEPALRQLHHSREP